LDKNAVVKTLEEMGTLLELQGANPFKSRAFHNAARVVEAITDDLVSIVADGRLQEFKGIGAGIAKIVADLVTTGRSAEHDELRASVPPGVLAMLNISGLGPKKVKLLYEKRGITGIDELEKAASDGTLATLDGFGEKTQENILRGIASLRTRSGRTLYSDAEAWASPILTALLDHPSVKRGEFAGSLRRRRETVGDADILLSAPASARASIMERFVSHPLVQSVLAHGDTKSSVVIGAGLQCDLRVVSDAEYPFALNYFTGCKEHNVEMRSRARAHGWSLNEYGFTLVPPAKGKKTGRKPPKSCKTEADVYKALGLQYIPPELRESSGEFEAAETGSVPDLVTWEQIRGTFHCHSTWSDGLHSLEQMAAAARDLGWEYLGIADHSKAAAYAGGLTPARVREQLREIETLNRKGGGAFLLSGTECDILPDGSLDFPDKLLAQFDYVVVSVHSSFKMSEEAMTRRVIKALKNTYVTMLGHPTGRLLQSRDPYPIDMREVLRAAADHGKLVEVNAHPMRLDMDWRLGRTAKKLGVKVCINPDAHHIDGLRDVRYGVGVARKGWMGPSDVLNTRSLTEVRKVLARMKG
jgi:DNA polymerase (family X)